jgi:hypothetical protein
VPGDSNILLRIDSASKAVWQERARREGLSLTRLIIVCVEEGLGVGKDAGVSVSTPPGAAAAAAHQPPSESQESLGAVAPPVTVHPPLPAPVAKVEPAPSTPAVAPSPRRAAVSGREHSSMCTCLMCKG